MHVDSFTLESVRLSVVVLVRAIAQVSKRKHRVLGLWFGLHQGNMHVNVSDDVVVIANRRIRRGVWKGGDN